jgi:tetratricopeptide (TPR) repeat protein
MDKRFGRSLPPGRRLPLTAWTCALAPDSLSDLAPAIASAQAAVEASNRSDTSLVTSGGVLYRAGRYQEAIECLTEPVALWDRGVPVTHDVSPAYAWFFLAMANQQLERPAEARTWLDRAVQWTEQKAEDPIDSEGEPLSWDRILTLELLRHEAESRLGIEESKIDAKHPSAKGQTTGLDITDE